VDFIKLRGAPYLESLHKTFFEFALVKAVIKVFTMKDLCVTTGFPELSGACMVFAVFRGCFHGPIFA